MFEKFLVILWFLLRPKFYNHLFFLIRRQFLINHDTFENRKKAIDWASKNTSSYATALKKIGLEGTLKGLDKTIIQDAINQSIKSNFKMGGAGHIHLLYDCVKILKPEIVVETGVAYGWSSLSILKALDDNNFGKLFSIDMPYPRKKNEKDVGIVVPENLRQNWSLIRKPDKPGLTETLKKIGKKIDICHYDSDKSWWGRHYAYPVLWNSLKSRGLFISDDIQDNLYFSEFVKDKPLKFAILEFKGKFIGLIRKP
jgi:predicted O-methyltransferase YrrM